jgi:predicted nucleotidyltransferase
VQPVLTDDVIAEAGKTLARAARSHARVILFGSWARGDAGPDSDLDFLVIEREPGSKLDEMVRLRDSLPPLGVPVDVLVVSEEHAEAWGQVPGTMVHAALAEGRVLAVK